jgi:hypothetical protein
MAATDFAEIFRPKSSGETVNVHVVESVKEPQPDFEAMRRIIEAGTSSQEESTFKRDPKN